MSSYETWLRSLDETQLAALLRRRSDVALDPPLRTYEALAHLLRTPRSVNAALRSIDRSAQSVLGAVSEHPSRTTLVAFFGDDTNVDRALEVLTKCGLVWPVADGFRRSPLHGRTIDAAPSLAPPELREAAELGRAAQEIAVARFADSLDSVLAEVDSGSVSLTKAGGVGVRLVRTLASAVKADDARDVELALTIADRAGLITSAGEVARCTTAYPSWRRSGRPAKMARSIAIWWTTESSPTNRIPFKGKAVQVLSSKMAYPSTVVLRHRMIAEMPEVGFANANAAVEYFEWRMPDLVGEANPGDVEAIFREASSLGVIAGGSPTELSRALGSIGPADPDAVESAITPLVAWVVDRGECTLRLLPDLTAVVSGPVSEQVAALLAASADVLSKDVASTWRFTPGSVRRHLDGGGSADELLSALSDASETVIPQSLEYLIRDCARRHGTLAVQSAASVIVSDDESLIQEIATIDGFGGRIVAPTVLTSSLSAQEALRVLRQAGHSPVADGPGVATVSRARVGRADRVTSYVWRRGTDPAVMASALVSGRPVEVDTDKLTRSIRAGTRLPARDADVLAKAVATGTTIRVDIADPKGGIVRDEMADVVLDSGVVHGRSARSNGWCSIELARIRMVAHPQA